MTGAVQLEHALPGLFSVAAPAPRVESGLRRMEKLADLLDNVVPVPGTSYRVGIDALIGVVPGIGDVLSGALQAYIVFESARLGVPRPVLAKMLGNLAVDTIVGTIPLLGGLFDAWFHASRRNVQLALEALR